MHRLTGLYNHASSSKESYSASGPREETKKHFWLSRERYGFWLANEVTRQSFFITAILVKSLILSGGLSHHGLGLIVSAQIIDVGTLQEIISCVPRCLMEG